MFLQTARVRLLAVLLLAVEMCAVFAVPLGILL